MSKTKIQIIEAMGLSDPDGEIEDCMTEWAHQAVSEYKKSLEAKLDELRIDLPISDIAHSHNATIAKIILELL